jgi:hypothetical protein
MRDEPILGSAPGITVGKHLPDVEEIWTVPFPRRIFRAILCFGVGWTFVGYLISAAISADSLRHQYDVPTLVQTRVSAGLPLVNMGSWNDCPLAIRASQQKIEG